MKVIKCEMCEGTAFSKEDGFFICQNCGLKYSLEEAKKLMVEVEGDTNVQNSTTVKSDTSAEKTNKLENLKKLARRARENDNSEDAQKYYELVLQEEPDDWEAQFFSVYFRAMQSKIANIASSARLVANCIGAVVGLIKKIPDANERKDALHELYFCCNNIATVLKDSAFNYYLEYMGDAKLDEYKVRGRESLQILVNLQKEVIENFNSEEQKENIVLIADSIIHFLEHLYNCVDHETLKQMKKNAYNLIFSLDDERRKEAYNEAKERRNKYSTYSVQKLEEEIEFLNSLKSEDVDCKDLIIECKKEISRKEVQRQAEIEEANRQQQMTNIVGVVVGIIAIVVFIVSLVSCLGY